MKYNAKIIGCFALLLFHYCIVQAANSKQANTVQWKWWSLASAKDSSSSNTIIVDSTQIAYIKSFLNDKYQYLEEDNSLKASIDTLQSGFSVFQTKVEDGDYNHTQIWVRLLLFINSAFLLVLMSFFIIRLVGLRDEVIRFVIGSDRVKEFIIKNSVQRDSLSCLKSYDGEIRILHKENQDFEKRIAQLEEATRTLEKRISLEDEDSRITEQPKIQTEVRRLLYADSINEKGVFSHVLEDPNEDTFFVLSLRNTELADVMLYQPAFGKIIANPAFLEGCETQIIGHTTVIVTDKGLAEREGNDKWRVTKIVKVVIN